MRINTKNGINGLHRNIKFSCFNPNKPIQHKISNIDYNKALTLHIDEQPELIYRKSPKSNSNNRKIKKKKCKKKIL